MLDPEASAQTALRRICYGRPGKCRESDSHDSPFPRLMKRFVRMVEFHVVMKIMPEGTW